ncbi:MAG: hypothetical protein OEN00_15225 [Gemmatimonadota bacterium]|nr:hypothetical protein [Gemmatimonadota bacterium]
MLRVVEAYFDHFESHPDLPHLLLQEVAAGKQPPDVVLEIIGQVKDAVAGLHTEGLRDGSVREGHPVLMALSVVSQPIYMTLIAPLLASVGGVDLSEPGVRQTAKQHVLEFVNAGLEPRPRSTTK